MVGSRTHRDDALESYLRDLVRVENEILALVHRVSPRTVVDVGVGDSTKSLTKRFTGYLVVVDSDCRKLTSFASEHRGAEARDLELVCADAASLPLRSSSIDLTMMHFVLHEMDPKRHLEVLASAKRVSRRILVVEPTPSGGEMFVRLWSIWRNAARAVGGFEEYRPPEYWLQLLEELGMDVIEVKVVSWRTYVPHEVLERMAASWIEDWKRRGVPEKHIRELEQFLKDAENRPLKWSDIVAILASSRDPHPQSLSEAR